MEGGQIMYNIKVSSVGPGKVTRPPGRMVEPGNMDLAMKLHYLRGVYYFGRLAFGGVTTLDVKATMFTWLNHHPITCGRFSRHHHSGRPYIKCNDCGVRFVEANCVHTLDDWLQKQNNNNDDNLLSSHQSIGPHLSFSPLVYIQLTRFKCGGAAVGLSWAHVLGDAFSAAEFMNSLGRVVAGFGPERPTNLLGHTPTITKYINGQLAKEEPLSIKRVDPVGDNWLHVAESEMEAFRFVVSPAQVSHLQAKSNDSPPFEAIAALIWRCVAKIRAQELEPRVVTIVCKTSSNEEPNSIGKNSQAVSVVKAGFPIAEASPGELAALVKNEALDERRMIEDAMERDHGLADYILYGANLTFVNLEEAKFYDFDYRGQKPIRVSYRIDGVGEKGAVLVLPTPADQKLGGGGRSVTAILPVNEMIGFKSELKREGLVVA